MPDITKEVRTIMYSVEPNGSVAVHKFPFNANDRDGMVKLQRFVDRGFTFTDPRGPGTPNLPTVLAQPVKKWRDMNAQERKAYQEGKKI